MGAVETKDTPPISIEQIMHSLTPADISAAFFEAIQYKKTWVLPEGVIYRTTLLINTRLRPSIVSFSSTIQYIAEEAWRRYAIDENV